MSFAKITVRFAANLKQFSSQMQNANRQMQGYGKNMQKVGQNLTLGLTAPLAGLGALSVKTFADFEQGLAKVTAVSGATAKEMQALRENAEDLGAATRFAATDVAGLQLNLSKLGFNPQEILDTTGAVLDLALATGEDLAQSATVAASTIRGFGLDASESGRVADVMAKSFSSSALDLEKFSTAMAVVAPVANVANQTIEDTTGMLSVLVNSGIDASTAGTGLRNIFLDLAKNGLTLDQALEKINTSSNQNATAMDLFGKRGATVATVLAANITQARELAGTYDNAAGSAKKMAAIMDNTLEGSFFKLKSAMESAAIAIGEVLGPVIRKGADFMAGLIARFKELSPTTKKIIVVIGAVVAAIGPLLVSAGFLMTTVIPGIIALLPTLGVAFTALTGPIGLVVAAIAGIAVVVYKNWDKIKAAMVDLANYFIDLYNESMAVRIAVETVILTFKNLWEAVKLVVNSIITVFSGMASYIFNSFKNVGAGIKAVLTGNFKEIPKILKAQGQLAADSLKNTFLDLGDDFAQFTNGVKDNLTGAIDAVTRKKITFVESNVDATGIKTAVEKAVTPTTPGPGSGPGGRARVGSVDAGVQAGPVAIPSPLEGIGQAVELMPQYAERLSTEYMRMMENAHEFNEGLTNILQGTATDFAASFGEMIGAAAAGSGSLAGLGKLILGTFADMAINIGKMAIGIGFAVEGIKKALQSLAGPVAIAAGIALVALGTFAKSALASTKPKVALADGGLVFGPTTALIGEYAGARSNPEVVAPLDKLKSMLGTPGQNIQVEVTGRLRGRDLALQGKRTNEYLNRLG